jgi:hypothetical protein
VPAPVAAGEAVHDGLLVHLAQRPRDPGLDRPPLDSPESEVLADAEPAVALVRHAAAGETLGEADVVEVALAPEALERGLDLVRVVPPVEEGTA